jgi:hypothetical protein
MKKQNWKVYYTDSIVDPVLKCVTNAVGGKPEQVNGFGVVGIAVEDEQVGWVFINSYDFYRFVDYVGNHKGSIIVKFGRNVPDKIWQEFIKIKLPKKSAYRKGERR